MHWGPETDQPPHRVVTFFESELVVALRLEVVQRHENLRVVDDVRQEVLLALPSTACGESTGSDAAALRSEHSCHRQRAQTHNTQQTIDSSRLPLTIVGIIRRCCTTR